MTTRLLRRLSATLSTLSYKQQPSSHVNSNIMQAFADFCKYLSCRHLQVVANTCHDSRLLVLYNVVWL